MVLTGRELMTPIAVAGKSDGPLLKNYLDQITDLIRLLAVVFSYLSQVRKDVLRNARPQLTAICSWKTPVGTTALFDLDVGKKLKELKAERFQEGGRYNNNYTR